MKVWCHDFADIDIFSMAWVPWIPARLVERRTEDYHVCEVTLFGSFPLWSLKFAESTASAEDLEDCQNYRLSGSEFDVAGVVLIVPSLDYKCHFRV